MEQSRLKELYEEYKGYNKDIKLGEIYGTCTLGEFLELIIHLRRITDILHLIKDITNYQPSSIEHATYTIQDVCRILQNLVSELER